MIELDGAQGEGGGQVLRTALALSAWTGQAFRIRRIRANRARPGLLRQHLTGVRAVAELCGAEVDGAALGATELTFRPGPVRPGEYTFAVGTAGSAGLVLQAVLPPLLGASGPSRVTVSGGTHNPASPPAQFLEHALFPLISRMGPPVTLRHEAWGFYPAGGGRYVVDVAPAPWRPLALEARGALQELELVAVIAHLDPRIAQRELVAARSILGLDREAGRIHEVESPGPGNAVLALARAEHVTEVFTSFGQKGVGAEDVAAAMARECVAWRDADVPVGEHLADQLLVPLAFAGGTFRTVAPTLHTQTAIEVIARFLGRAPRLEAEGERAWRVSA